METKTRFDLNAAVQNWQQELAAQPDLTPEVRRELETHLCDTVVEFQRYGFNDEESFLRARRRLGQPRQLSREYMKSNPLQWNRPAALTAWAIFVISFFLPSYNDGYGYQCALLQSTFWSGAIHGEVAPVNYELLTLANLLMLVSPLLVFRLNGKASQSWLRWLTFTAMFLVWSFVIQLLAHDERKELKIGCYVWSLSFALLFYSTVSKNVFVRKTLKHA